MSIDNSTTKIETDVMNFIANILHNELSSEMLIAFLQDCHLNDTQVSSDLHTQEALKASFIRFTQDLDIEYLQTMKPQLLIYRFLVSKIEHIDDKNLARLLNILQLIPSQHLSVLSSIEFQTFKNELRQYSYCEPAPYSPTQDDDKDEPETPVEGLPSTATVLFIPEGYCMGDIKVKRSMSRKSNKPVLKIDTGRAKEDSCPSTPLVVLDRSFLDV